MDVLLRVLFGNLSPGGPHARLQALIFHRVIAVSDPLLPGEVRASHFDEAFRWLRAWFNVLPFDKAVARLKVRCLPPRALAITFVDDGYASDHHVALPSSPGMASDALDCRQLPWFTPWDGDRARLAQRLAPNLRARPAAGTVVARLSA